MPNGLGINGLYLLYREEDHDRSDDEEDRVEFNVDKHEQDLRRMQNTILEAEQGMYVDNRCFC
jgi:hypothetical protein